MRLGSGYKGSSSLLNSGVGNVEIIPMKDGTDKPYCFYKFEFKTVDTAAVVKINNEDDIYLHNGYFSIDEIDQQIYSFVVVTEDINYSWIGAYVYR